MSWRVPEKHPEYDNSLACGFHGTPSKMSLRLVLDGSSPSLPDLLGDLSSAAEKLLSGPAKADVGRLRRLGAERADLAKRHREAQAAAANKVAALDAKRGRLTAEVPAGVATELAAVAARVAEAEAEPLALEKQLALLDELLAPLRAKVEPAVAECVGQAAAGRLRELLAEQVTVARELTRLAGVAEALDKLAAIRLAVARAADAVNSQALKAQTARALLAPATTADAA
jgi:hypothetical protein